MLKFLAKVGVFLSIVGIGIMIEKEVLAPARLLDMLEDLYKRAQNTTATKIDQSVFLDTARNFYETGVKHAAQSEIEKLSRVLFDFETYINTNT